MEYQLLIKIGKIVDVEDHPDADKLYVVAVDLGDEERQLVAGLKEIYRMDELKGKNVAVLCNLKPAKIRGVISEGMLLAADDGNRVALITSDTDVGAVALPEGVEIDTDSMPRISFEKFMKHGLKVKDGCVVWQDRKLLAEDSVLYPEREVKDGALVR